MMLGWEPKGLGIEPPQGIGEKEIFRKTGKKS